MPITETRGRRSRTSLIAAGAIAVLLGIACALLLAQNFKLQKRLEFSAGPRPTVDALWRQMFGNGRQTDVVLSDGNLVIFENEIRQQVSVADYQDRAFARMANERIQDPVKRELAISVLNRRLTNVPDAAVGAAMAVIGASNQLPINLVMARDFRASQFSTHNVVLLGSRRANPWIEAFEEKLNFRTVFQEEPRAVHFTNQSPQPGEEPVYRGRWGGLGYCRVAYMPNENGTLLLISGTDVHLTEAGGKFVTSENRVQQLRSALKLSVGQEMPYFEALLKGVIADTEVLKFDLVSVRRH